MFDLLKKYKHKVLRGRGAGDFQFSGDGKLSDLNKLLISIRDDTEIEPHDALILMNIAIIEAYPYEIKNCSDEIVEYTNASLKGMKQYIKEIAIDTLKAQRVPIEERRIAENMEQGMSKWDATAEARQYIDSNSLEITDDQIIDTLVHNPEIDYNKDEINFIVNRLLISRGNIYYDIFKCSRIIITDLINDFAHFSYLKMLSGFKDIIFWRNLHVMLKFMKVDPLTGSYHLDKLENAEDRTLIAEITQYTHERGYRSNNMDVRKLSGETLLKLAKGKSYMYKLFEYNKDPFFKMLIEASEIYESIHEMLSERFPEIYELKWPEFSGKNFERIMESVVDTRGKCLAADIDINEINANEWCRDGNATPQKQLLLHPAKNRDCPELAQERADQLQTMCQSNRGEMVDPNVRKLNAIIYSNENVTYDEQFIQFLANREVDRSASISTSFDTKYNIFSDKVFTNYLGESMIALLQYL